MKTAIAVAVLLGAGAARADFFNGNAEDFYSATGSFSFTHTLSTSGSAIIQTRSGLWRLSSGVAPSGGPPGEFNWELFLDLAAPSPYPSPWTSREISNDWPSDYVGFAVVGTPEETTEATLGGFPAHVSETYHLGQYSQWYETTLVLDPYSFAFDGVDTFTLAGTWSYSSVLMESQGLRPTGPVGATVPEGGAGLLAFLTVLGLAAARRNLV